MPKLFWPWKEAPTQIRMYPCPACNETISAATTACRFCHLPIDANTAQQLVTKSQLVTTAVTQANTFSLSTSAAVLVIGFALLILYMDRSLNTVLFLCPLIALAYGGQWLYRNRSHVTHDADYPPAITKVKRTMVVWVAVLLVQLVAYIILNGLPDRRNMIGQVPQPLLRKIIDDGNDRPVLNISGVTAREFSPSQTNPFPASTLIEVKLRNDGNTSARVTKTVAQTHLSSGDCDMTLFYNGSTGLAREIQPQTEEPFYFGLKVNSPCKISIVLKVSVVYTNLHSGVEYTQELPASPQLSLEYPQSSGRE